MIVGLCLGLIAGVAKGNDVYLSQAGGGAGSSCSSTLAVSYFNTAGNWTSGTPTGTKIGPGTTVHLCGTFTFAAGVSGLTVQGSGASGNPVTIHFESGAVLQSPYFPGEIGVLGGAIVISGKNYITVDGGGANGLIKNTLDGSPGETCPGGACAYQQPTSGVYIADSTGTTVENLTIGPLYVDCGASTSCTDSAGQNTSDITVDTGTITNLVINGNYLGEARMGFNEATGNSSVVSNVTISNNTTNDNDWSLIIGADDTSTLSGISFYGNDVSNWTDWENPPATYHQDGVFIYAGGTTPATTVEIYDNYFHGNFGTAGGGTSFISCGTNEPPAQGNMTCNIFNNLFVSTPPGATAAWLSQVKASNIYNNTFIGPGAYSGPTPLIITINSAIVKNNIFYDWETAIATYDTSFSSIAASNYNLFYDMVGTLWFSANIGVGSGPQYTYAQWQGLGYDGNSTTGNPNLSTSYLLQSGSAAIGAATNLTSLGITQLDTSAPATFGVGGACGTGGCAARPSTGAWDIGAYQSVDNPLAPPSNLAAVAH